VVSAHHRFRYPTRLSRRLVGTRLRWARNHIPAHVTAVSYTAGTDFLETAISSTIASGSRLTQSGQSPQSPAHRDGWLATRLAAAAGGRTFGYGCAAPDAIAHFCHFPSNPSASTSARHASP
jgi:hypothetical protein